MTEATTSLKYTFTGCVASNKTDKAVTVLVENRVKYPLYGRYVICSEKYHTHDEANRYNESGKIEITELCPLSHTRSWVVLRPLEVIRVI